jgi:hypothetical protein
MTHLPKIRDFNGTMMIGYCAENYVKSAKSLRKKWKSTLMENALNAELIPSYCGIVKAFPVLK